MLLEAQKGNAEIIGKAVALLRGKVPEGKIALAETFTRQYYSWVEAEDLAERNLCDLCGAALAHLDFMGKFKSRCPQATRLQPANPEGRMGVATYDHRDCQ
jgi:glutamate dehydrogenase